MSVLKNATQRILAVGLISGLGVGVACAIPVTVSPGDVGDPVGIYSGPVPPYTLVTSPVPAPQEGLIGPVVVAWDEAVVTTPINPFGAKGEVFVFAAASTAALANLSLSLTGFTGYSTAIEACDPVTFGGGLACGLSAGSAARSADGSTITITGVGETAGVFAGIPANVTDLYAIFTNATSFTDPTACISGSVVGAAAGKVCVDSLGPSGPTTGGGGSSVPEPGGLALLGLGVLGAMLRRRRS